MSASPKSIAVTVERTIPAAPREVYAAWLNPKTPGTPWHEADKLILNPKVDGFFYWLIRGTPHYGRFTKTERPGRIQHTWMSPNTMGQESMVTVTFKKKKEGTLMTLVHTGLPDNPNGRGHEGGWTYFIGKFLGQFEAAARKRK